VRTVSGTVCVILPKTKRCIPIEGLRSIPVGTIIDARRGVVELTTAADAKGGTQTGTFGGSKFLFDQVTEQRTRRVRNSAGQLVTRKRKVLVTLLSLRGGNPGSCAGSRLTPRVLGNASARRFTRYLRARAHGRFRVSGRSSSGIERGTAWTTKDNCSGTLTTVTQGAVLVTDFAKDKTILVRAPGRYLAEPARKR